MEISPLEGGHGGKIRKFSLNRFYSIQKRPSIWEAFFLAYLPSSPLAPLPGGKAYMRIRYGSYEIYFLRDFQFKHYFYEQTKTNM
jgi:hypothetical protein